MRISKLIKELKALELEGMVIADPKNRRYISGFTGSSGVLFLDVRGNRYIISDFRYREQISHECDGFTYVEVAGELFAFLSAFLQDLGIETCGFEPDSLTVSQHAALSSRTDCSLQPVSGLIEGLRQIKDKQEVANITKAAVIADRAFDSTLRFIRPGVTEAEVAAEIDYAMRKYGAEASAFQTIVAAGENSSLPHHGPGQRKLALGEFVTMDFGCKVGGYCSDMTRTIAVGSVSPEMERVYRVVLGAQKAALDELLTERSCFTLDATARAYIDGKGFAGHFGHGLGHGVGLDVHEEPRLSPHSTDTLKPGMVVSVEPGIYVAGEYGVRIEDICLITTTGYRNLVASRKDLIIL
ncbi:MAG: M24 family metallopeptidase [Christensenellales bacterium]|jgi:Xaa-Pro aminopeptidase